jgi:teichuronic acid biosynthesis glycosyltransferase TuaC
MKRMRISWVARAGKNTTFKAVINNQLQSFVLFSKSIKVDPFPIKGNSSLSYLKSVIPLIRFIHKHKPEVIHAHYSYSAFLIGLLFPFKPLMVSLMGSDVEGGIFRKQLIRLFSKLFWNKTIVKSHSLKQKLGINKVEVLPNGVDLKRFELIDSNVCKHKLKWDKNKIQVLFLADPNRREKNYALAEEAFKKVSDSKTELKVLFNQPVEKIPEIINASDIVLLTSLWEGSPNVIKEAMACNKAIVSTPVGDVAWLLGDFNGHYITDFDSNHIAAELSKAIEFVRKQKQTKGRERIISLGIDSHSISQKLEKIYFDVAKRN